MFVPFVAMDANAFQYGVGTHQWDVKLSNVFVTLKVSFLGEGKDLGYYQPLKSALLVFISLRNRLWTDSFHYQAFDPAPI